MIEHQASELDLVRKDLQDQIVKSSQNETNDKMANIKKDIDNKITKDEMEKEKAATQQTEENYASKIKHEVDLHLNGMDNQISCVSMKIHAVRKQTILEQDRESRMSSIILYNVGESHSPHEEECCRENFA